jgi:hypothetical protein
MSVTKEDRENARLVRERVKCGKPSCRCARDAKYRHGPYTSLRFEEFDHQTGQVFYHREYVPASELARVRQWVRRSRAAGASRRDRLETALLGQFRER